MEAKIDPVADTTPPSTTNAQCKVCGSPDRFGIEVALAEGQSQEAIARRFSRDGQLFNRQNIHSHYHRHMEVIERAVTEAAAAGLRNRMLDIGTAIEIDERNERNRTLMREQLAARIEENSMRWTAKDAMAFMQQDQSLNETRSVRQFEAFMTEARAFKAAVKHVVPEEMWMAVVNRFDELSKDAASDLHTGDRNSPPDKEA